MEFHVSRVIRDKTGVDDALFNYAGNVVFADLSAGREFVKRYNEQRAAGKVEGSALNAGALFAMGLIDELNHAMIARYRETLDPELLPMALQWLERKKNREQVEGLLRTFTAEFPNVSVYRGKQTVEQWLAAATASSETGTRKDLPNREIAVEELFMLWLANSNPGFSPFKELFDDRELEQNTIYRNAAVDFPAFFATRPPLSAIQGSLLDVLRAPALASPDSLSGQLAYIRDNWVEYLGEEFSAILRRTILASDVLKEEEIAIWMMFHPPSGGHYRHGEPKWGSQGFVGDEFVGYEDDFVLGADGRRRMREEPRPMHEYEAFSPDQAWMPTVVMIAKSTYVWLEQLSKKYLRHIYRLDQIPAEEFAILADRGINALWLIGLWERSTASQTIKRMMGQGDAVASAYSLKDYRIADDLGGNYAYERLRDLAGSRGIRLASDMVPNHMGIDSTWVMEHPEWFLSRQDSPFPVYSFEGPDLSSESRFEIKIEDHYFDQTDAAVVFRLRERSNGHTRFVYHGNDGTTFAWNDTAQLDYSKWFVREQVIQTILNVAKLFPIIRFDAAMTLAKKHVQRLWFPLPGIGGSIPSRAESAISEAEFDALMPHEFWREVVDRVAAEVPGTLLLAEAFWLLEGYFVRTLGMHRVYNSAFMNMLRDEENAKYRSYLKKTIEFDPDILKRYVNFMSNPDERTAIDQFGTGDKYFGTCTMLATLPGLPMIGHGQIEGFTEKYGMEYKQARFVEWPNEDLVARHQREIAPLLKNRPLFAESHNFVLYDFWLGEGSVNENVFAYSNRLDHGGDGHGGSGKERALVLYNNAYESTRGTIHLSCASMDKYTGELRQRTITDALNLPVEAGVYLAWRNSTTRLEYLRSATDFDHSGFTIDLRGYQHAVLCDWRELRSTAEKPWDQLAGALNGGGVYNLNEALTKLRLRPLHEALRQALAPDMLRTFIDTSLRYSAESLVLKTKIAEAANPEDQTSDSPPKKESSRGGLINTNQKISRRMSPMAQNTNVRTRAQPDEAVLNTVRDELLVEFLHRGEVFRNQLKPFLNGQEILSEEGSTQQSPSFSRAVIAATRIALNEQFFKQPWPETARKLLPTIRNGKSVEGADLLWAPIVAWILVNEFIRAATEDTDQAVALFDSLYLRSALAETLTSLGLDEQSAWRSAARVRTLLAYPSITTLHALADQRFWSDGDVRWLACLSESDEVTYLNKECFEEMVWWLQLPRLLEATGKEQFEEVQEFVDIANSALVSSKYDLAAFCAKPATESKKPKAKSISVHPGTEDNLGIAAEESSATPVTSKK